MPKAVAASPEIHCESISPRHWRDIETLFGPRGACAGCWCMWWRLPEKTRGEPAKRAFKKLVLSGEALGILAYHGRTPVGWCAFGPRTAFPRIERTRALADTGDGDLGELCSINCFYIAAKYRRCGITRRLLAAAVEECKRRGARRIEGYPVKVSKRGPRLASGDAYGGASVIFADLGFALAKTRAKHRMLARLRVDVPPA